MEIIAEPRTLVNLETIYYFCNLCLDTGFPRGRGKTRSDM